MKLKKLPTIALFVILGWLAFLSQASGSALPGLQITPTAGPKIKPLPLAAQAGNSDWIVVLGILIFILIAVPILLRYHTPKKP